MTEQSARWRNLGIAAAAMAAALYAAFDVYQWISVFEYDHFHNDFTFYFAAARVGLSDGWPSLYDLARQQAELTAMGSGITIAELARYISPPPLAWLVVPFTALPYPAAYWAWSLLLLLALVVTWWCAAPDAGRARVIYLAAAVGWFPVIYGLQLGQPAMIVAASVAVSYALLRRNHPWWAGVALGALALKPQLAFLVPLGLLAARRYRAFAGSVIALGLLAALSAVALGPSGVSAYLDRLHFASTVPVNRALTLAYVLGDAARPVQVFVAAWTMLVIYRLRHRGVEWIYACALAGGMLATPYAHLDDLAMLGLAAWLALRAGVPVLVCVYFLVGAIGIEGEPLLGPLPVLVIELVALVLISRAAQTLPQIDARPLELHPKQ